MYIYIYCRYKLYIYNVYLYIAMGNAKPRGLKTTVILNLSFYATYFSSA